MEEFEIYTYDNILLYVTIGLKYGGEGYSGMTDGVDVKGELTEVNKIHDSATIWSDKLNYPCSVKLKSLYKLN